MKKSKIILIFYFNCLALNFLLQIVDDNCSFTNEYFLSFELNLSFKFNFGIILKNKNSITTELNEFSF